MALINAALLLPYTVSWEEEKKTERSPSNKGERPQNLVLQNHLQSQNQASQALEEADVPFEFAKHQRTKHKAPQIQKNIVDERKHINPKPQVAALPRDSIRRRRNLSCTQPPTKYRIKRQHGGNGSLFNAISRAKSESIIDGLKWVGLTGIATDNMFEATRRQVVKDMEKHDCHPVFVDDKTYVGHYYHYSKDILFPTFHSQVPEILKSKSYEDQSWMDYYAVNRQIADKIISLYQPGDKIWVHDYHLMLVPQMVREALANAPISFFMHVSFPTSEVFRLLAHRSDILHGLLGANCIGFQNNDYAQHFMMTASRILAYDTTGNCVQTPEIDVHIFVSPIGIDPDRLNELRDTTKVLEHREKIRARWPNAHIIGARDKLDPTRGIVPKLKAYGALLDERPELAATTVLIQICLPSVSTNSDLETEIATISESINSKHGDIASGIHPLIVLRRDILFEQYLALIAEADTFAVTCLRDGMNLTSHEFVYCNKRQGPLVLSEFTGSASVLGDNSLLVNPWDIKGLKNAFRTALEMSDEEKESRHQHLMNVILSQTCMDWIKECLDHMQKAWKDDSARSCKLPNIDDLSLTWSSQESRFITFEIPTGRAMEGIDFPTNPKVRKSDSHSTKTSYFSTRLTLMLAKLLNDPKNIIYVSSAESRRYMERKFRTVPTVGLIAESGRYVRLHNTEKWIEVGLDTSCHWKHDLQPILDTMRERLPISSLQVHDSTVVVDFEFSNEDQERQLVTIGEYVGLIDDTFGEDGLRCRFDRNQLTVYPLGLISLRTRSLSMILSTISEPVGPMFLATQPLATDEDDILFAKLLDLQAKKKIKDLVTFCCGRSPSLAQYRVQGINSLMTLFGSLEDKTSESSESSVV